MELIFLPPAPSSPAHLPGCTGGVSEPRLSFGSGAPNLKRNNSVQAADTGGKKGRGQDEG